MKVWQKRNYTDLIAKWPPFSLHFAFFLDMRNIVACAVKSVLTDVQRNRSKNGRENAYRTTEGANNLSTNTLQI